MPPFVSDLTGKGSSLYNIEKGGGCMEQTFTVTLYPANKKIPASGGEVLLDLLRRSGTALQAPCGGHGTCGKCKALVDGREQLACRTVIDRDMTVEAPHWIENAAILSESIGTQIAADADITGKLLAIDLGTTTMVCYLLDGAGRELAVASALNPQGVYGADVISRIQMAQAGGLAELSSCVRQGLEKLIREVCAKAGAAPEEIQRIALVANPCMQQLLMGFSPENLAKVPFAPVLTRMKAVPAGGICPNGEFLIVPDLSGFVGADTLGCVLATQMYKKETITLLVDIGTNGEMVLGNKDRMLACSTAAGPAMEGANIRFGMRCSLGAIDHVTWEDGRPHAHVIGGGKAAGICGSGIIDAVAGMLKAGLINSRGRILSAESEFEGERAFYLTDEICLTQTDIRQVQLAKGAIAAGIELLAKHFGILLEEIGEVLLAGAFGSFLDPQSACAIGLLPPVLLPKIRPVGNAAGSGAKLLACSRQQQSIADRLCKEMEFLELASLPEFQSTFGRQTHFLR